MDMMVEDILTGLRLAGMVLFTWLAWRVLFESQEITAQGVIVRIQAWRFFRAGVLSICFVMIFLASPENILRANGMIDDQIGFAMMIGVTLGAILYAGLNHHALDIATSQRGATWFACVLITLSSCAWGARGLLQ